MTITTTYRWNGKLGAKWDADVPNPPGPNLINWDVLSGPNPPPGPPSGAGDLAVIDLGGAISITGPGGAEELQVVAASTVTFSSGHFGFGQDNLGGMLIEEDAVLVISASGTVANDGSLDIIGLTGNGSLQLQSNAGFDDRNMIVGADKDATGTVTADAAFAFEVVGPSTTDGVLTVGEDGIGTVDLSGTPFFATTVILGKNTGSTGNLSFSGAIWGGSSLTVGQEGTGNATIAAGANVAIENVVVGAVAGTDSLDISGGSQFGSDFAILGEAAGTTGDATLNASTWNGATLTVGMDGTGNATIEAGSTLQFGDLIVGQNGAEASGSIDVSGSSTLTTNTVVLGEGDGSTGSVTLNDSIWNGGSLTVGQGGSGNAAIESGSTAQFSDVAVGPNGEIDVTGAGGDPGTLIATTSFTLEFGTLDVTGGGEVLVGASSGVAGAVSVDGAGSPLVGLGTLNGNVILGNQGTVEATQPIPGSLFVDGNIHGTGTIEPLMTLEVTGGIDAGVTIAFGPSIGGQVGDLILDTPAANLGTIVGFGHGNTIDVQGSVYTDAVFTQGTSDSAGTLTLSGPTLPPLSIAVEGDYAPDSFHITQGTTDTVVTLCFATGTHIATPQGEVPVELLAAGDQVLTASGAVRSIVWIGAGQVLATRGRRNAATPVIVRRGALANNVPHRDLRLTKGHSLFIDGVLIPIEELINHRSIEWDDRAQEVAIYHIELATHDVLLADGAPAESYRDDGNRWLFRNANPAWHLPPQQPCAPVVTGGPLVDAIWRRLLGRAGPRPGGALTEDPDLHLLVDGRRVDAASHSESFQVFAVSSPPTNVRICSRSAVPQELGLARDPRVLGVALRRILVRQGVRVRTADVNDARLVHGFHAFEPDHGLRWTDGNAAVPAAMFAGFSGQVEIVLQLAATTRYLDLGQSLHVA